MVLMQGRTCGIYLSVLGLLGLLTCFCCCGKHHDSKSYLGEKGKTFQFILLGQSSLLSQVRAEAQAGIEVNTMEKYLLIDFAPGLLFIQHGYLL